MKLRFRLAAFAFVVFGASALASADDVTLQFLHALQKNGYEDIAVEYLKTLQKQPNMPAELRDVFDLEMSNSLRGAANRAYDAKEKEQMMADSQTSLEKFLKDKPDHPAAISAMVSAADLAIDHAQKSLRTAKYLEEKDKDQKAKHLAEARTSLEDAQKKLKTATEKFRVRLAALPEVPKSTGKNRKDIQKAQQAREAAAQDYVEAVGKSAMVQYFLAQTFAKPDDPERKKMLTDAAKAFDGIYQKRRLEIAGLYAHMWHGKCMEEAGDTRLALDIYDEVLANAPDPGEASADPALEPVFAQVEYFRLLILAKQKPEQFLPEAEQWLKAYKKIKATGGYQGVMLEVAKAKLAASEKATGAAEKAKFKQEATALFRDMRKVPSMYQQEAIQIMLQLGGGEASSFDDAVVLGNEAAEAKRWTEAIDNYRKALDFAQKSKVKETEKVAQTREALAQCMLVVARQNFSKNQLEDCLTMASTLIKELGTEPPAALAISSLGVYAALNLYANTPEAEKEKKEAALQRLGKIASFVITTWPAKPEADDARMALANSKLVVGEIDEALKRFDEVNPKSERHPQALYYAGRTYWGRYQTEKAKAEDKRNKEQMASDRTKAQERLLASLEAQRKPSEASKKKEEPKKEEPKPEEAKKPDDESQEKEADTKNAAEEKAAQLVAETQLMLGEILVEAGQPKDAVGYFQPLMDGLDKEKTKGMDLKLLLRIYVGAFRSYLAASDLAKAGDVGVGLADAAADNQFVNGWLMDFARQLNDEYKKAEAERISATEATQKDAANAKLQAVKEPLGKVLAKLGERQVSGKGLMFVADTLSAVGLTTEATKVYDEILKRLENDEEFAKSVGVTAPTRARTQLIEIESTKGNYEKALKEVDKLVADNKRALEPRMTKGRILQQWCEKDPSHYPEAVKHWAETRDLLQRMKKKPPELIEVVYNISACLLYQARSEKNKENATKRALEGEQVLKAMLFNNPTLDKRPDMVARYKDLLAKLAALQGRKPTPDKPAADAKAPADGKPAPSPVAAAKKP